MQHTHAVLLSVCRPHMLACSTTRRAYTINSWFRPNFHHGTARNLAACILTSRSSRISLIPTLTAHALPYSQQKRFFLSATSTAKSFEQSTCHNKDGSTDGSGDTQNIRTGGSGDFENNRGDRTRERLSRMQAIASRRRSTKSLYETDSSREVHSNLLSEHPLKIKYDAQRLAAIQAKAAEEAYRDRTNTMKQRKATEATAELERVHRDVAFHRTKEYKWYLASGVSGHLLSSYIVYNYYYAEDARLEYDPVAGYVDDLKRKKDEISAEDALMNKNGVLDHFLKNKKEMRAKI